MPGNKLTIETIEAAIKDLERMRQEYEQEVGGYKFQLIKNNWLTGMQMIIRSGGKAYYSSDIKSGEIKIIDLPEFLEYDKQGIQISQEY